MAKTKNDLPETTRTKMATLLNAWLADAIDLALQSKHAHWNVKGPSFQSLHRLFDDVYEAVDEYVDLIAERIVQLGGLADGTAASVVKRSSLPPYPAMPQMGWITSAASRPPSGRSVRWRERRSRTSVIGATRPRRTS